MNVRAGSESDLLAKAAIAPVTVAIDGLRRSFMFYSGGYYYEPTCSTTNLNHAVLVVGWGTDATHGDYWLAKNQWGSCTVAYPTLPYPPPNSFLTSCLYVSCAHLVHCHARSLGRCGIRVHGAQQEQQLRRRLARRATVPGLNLPHNPQRRRRR